MSLLEKISEDLKTAMRQKDEVARETLRMLKSEITTLDNPDELSVLSRAVKSRTDSAKSYREGGREDLAAREEEEIAVIRRYLPEEMSDDQARTAIGELAKDLGVESKKDMGRLMKAVMDKYRGQIDGKTASAIAAQILQ